MQKTEQVVAPFCMYQLVTEDRVELTFTQQSLDPEWE
jgi:hypothetical protein